MTNAELQSFKLPLERVAYSLQRNAQVDSQKEEDTKGLIRVSISFALDLLC